MVPGESSFLPCFLSGFRPWLWDKVAALFTTLALAGVLHSQVSVTTYHNDQGRTGQNLSEPYLAPGNVRSATFGKLYSVPLDGAAYAQPLYLPAVNIPGLGTHNVVYVATQHDSVLAFDADSAGAPLWQVSFIDPPNGVTTVDSITILSCEDILPETGITSTPVIDPSTNTLYIVSKTNEDGTIVQRLHALDVTSGVEKFGGPVVIQGQVLGDGAGSAGAFLTFDPLKQNQRAGLLLQNGLVYIAWASHCDNGPYHGWVMAYDAGTLQQTAQWVSTPNGSAGGIWQGGAPLAADSNFVYLSTGNGTFDLQNGGVDAGDTILKFSPPANDTFSIADYFTPYNQNTLRLYDTDLGSGGVMLLPDQPDGSPYQHLMVTGGKEGTLYLINRDQMGNYSSVADLNVQTLVKTTHGIYSTPAWWNNNLYLGGSQTPLHAYSFDPNSGTFAAAPSSVSSNLLGGHSPTPSISANGTANAIVWALDNQAWATGKPTVLYAYDANNLANLLYSSKQNSARDNAGPAVKFTVPTVTNGKVYVGTTNKLSVFGLLLNMSLNSGGGQTANAGSLLPVSLSVTLTDPYSQNPVPGVTITFSDGGKLGSFSNPTVVTDSNGSASTSYTLPKKAQTVTITMSAPAAMVVKTTETGVPGPAANVIVVGGNNQTGPVSTPLPAQLAAKVRDQYGNGVPGIPVTFSDGGLGGGFSSNPVASGSTGISLVTYTTPPTTGTVKVKASVPTVNLPATFTETVQ